MKSRIFSLFLLISLVAVFSLAYGFQSRADAKQEAKAETVKQWQHLALRSSPELDQELSKKINHLGDQGWELVCVVPQIEDGTTTKLTYCFKRPK